MKSRRQIEDMLWYNIKPKMESKFNDKLGYDLLKCLLNRVRDNTELLWDEAGYKVRRNIRG